METALSFSTHPMIWITFIGGVVLLLILDLFVFHKDSHIIKTKEALWTSVFFVGVALAYNFWFSFQFGSQLGLEFLTAYIVEKSLSIDNLFVILLIFQSFKIPAKYQHEVLFWGILGAIVMRGAMILAGLSLLEHFHFVIYIFGLILIYSGVKFLRESDEEKDVTDSFFIKGFKKMYPVTQDLNSGNFFTIENGVRKATPLFLALLAIEFTDLIFAVDSVPAVLAVTRDPFVAFSSNILAILGLRALFFLIADLVSKLRYLKPGLSMILIFVGCKMLIIDFYKFPSWVSLLVILGILSTAALSSWYVAKRES